MGYHHHRKRIKKQQKTPNTYLDVVKVTSNEHKKTPNELKTPSNLEPVENKKII